MIVAGEASGDLHGSNLVLATQKAAPEVGFFGVGGPRLEAVGAELLYDLESMSLMGLSEVVSGLGRALAVLRDLRLRLARDKPAALVLIDYPDFNLMLAKTAKRLGVPVFYYICPQIWAWRTGRVRKMGRLVDRRVVVFPFEKDFYRRYGLEADFVGHPLLDIMPAPRPKSEAKAALGLDPKQNLLLLMPGSRKHVVQTLLPDMFETLRQIRLVRPHLVAALARAENLANDFYAPFLEQGPPGVMVFGGSSHALQNAADVALVASGTSTVETALMQTPMVVVYRVSPVSYALGRLLVKTPHVAMANLIAGERLVPELLQNQVNPDIIVPELIRLLDDAPERERVLAGLARVRERLGGPGASRRAAELLLKTAGILPQTAPPGPSEL